MDTINFNRPEQIFAVSVNAIPTTYKKPVCKICYQEQILDLSLFKKLKNTCPEKYFLLTMMQFVLRINDLHRFFQYSLQKALWMSQHRWKKIVLILTGTMSHVKFLQYCYCKYVKNGAKRSRHQPTHFIVELTKSHYPCNVSLFNMTILYLLSILKKNCFAGMLNIKICKQSTYGSLD